MNNYRDKLFNSYHAHTSLLDEDHYKKIKWFSWYYKVNYQVHIPNNKPHSEINVLEIGCNKGYLLRVLSDSGFQSLTGIDLSPGDLDVAKIICPTATLSCVDAFDFLRDNKKSYSLIIIKAVLEHVPKSQILQFISAMSDALEPGGRLIIDVPNMDWLFAAHERYMDFTHEVGFTRESLAQVMREYFDSVSIHPIETSMIDGKWRLLLKYFSRILVSLLLRGVQSDWPGKVSWCRALVGVGVKR
jgi:2-polyprenyl-3-methyl-5-hydroxy-6-metoxy-1,4-benzoquinol methylase